MAQRDLLALVQVIQTLDILVPQLFECKSIRKMRLFLVRLRLTVIVGVLLDPSFDGFLFQRNFAIVLFVLQAVHKIISALNSALTAILKIAVTDAVRHVIELEAHLHLQTKMSVYTYTSCKKYKVLTYKDKK